MQPKNIVLLGFVNKAVEYLDKHIDDDKSDYKLNKLKNIDLVSLEEELSKNLEFSLGSYQSTMTSLLKAGNEAFDEFLDAHTEKVDLLSDLNTIFDVEEDNVVHNDKQELEDLLSFYNLDSSLNVSEDDVIENDDEKLVSEQDDSSFEDIINQSEEKQEENQKNIEQVTAKIIDKLLTNNPLLRSLMNMPSNEEETETVKQEDIDSVKQEIINESAKKEPENSVEETESILENLITEDVVTETQEENDDDNSIDQIEDEFLRQIAKAADENKADIENGIDELHESSNNEEIDTIFSEILDHENAPVVLEPEETVKEDKIIDHNELFEDIQDEIRTEAQIIDGHFSTPQEEPIQEEPVLEEPVLEEPVQEETNEELSSEINLEDDIPVEEETVDAKVDVEKELQTIINYVPETLREDDFEEPKVVSEEIKQPSNDTYVSSLIEDLKRQMIEEEKIKIQEDEARQEVYGEIHKTYPYLSSAFIKSVYDLKNGINDEYAEGMNVILLSRIIFENVEELRQFAEVVMNHGYQINVDEKQLIVDCLKQFTNTKGKIIALIFDIANQAAALNGIYEGYRVVVAEV